MHWYEWHSLCLYVYNGLPRQAHPPKVKYSLSAVYEQAIRQNILLCEDVLVLEDHYIHTSRENKALDSEYFWPVQTCIQAKRERRWSLYLLIVWKTLFGLPCSKIQLLELVIMMMFGYVTGSDRLFRGNQIDWVIKWVSWFQVFSKEIKSNAVSKLFILVWSYEGMKVLDLGYEKRWKKFSHSYNMSHFQHFSSSFLHDTQVTNKHFLACDRNPDLHN